MGDSRPPQEISTTEQQKNVAGQTEQEQDEAEQTELVPELTPATQTTPKDDTRPRVSSDAVRTLHFGGLDSASNGVQNNSNETTGVLNLLRTVLAEKTVEYNFDFEKGKPLPPSPNDNYLWDETVTDDGTQAKENGSVGDSGMEDDASQ